MFEKTKQKFLEKKNIIIYSILTIGIGIILLMALNSYESSVILGVSVHYEKVQLFEDNRTYYNVIQPIIYNIAIILIVLGSGTLLFELFGYLSYFRKRISEVFTELDLLKLLDDEYKRKLKFNLTKTLYKPNTEDSQEILNLFDKRIGSVLKDYYYSKYVLHIDCSIFNKKYIQKTIEKNVVIKEINSKNKNFIKNLLRLACPELESDVSFKQFEINHIKIDEEVINENDYSCNRTIEKDSNYPNIISVTLNKKREIKDELKLNIKYTTIVPLEDRTYNFMVDHLCKELRAKFCFDYNEMSVKGTGFEFSTSEECGSSTTPYKSLTEIESNGWVLPGEGISFSIFQKNR